MPVAMSKGGLVVRTVPAVTFVCHRLCSTAANTGYGALGNDVAGSRPTGEEFRAKHEIALHGDVQGFDVEPAQDFESLRLGDGEAMPNSVMRYIQSKGYEAPSPIQAQSLPLSLAERDLIAVAQTGSGKTLGFLLPLFWRIARTRRDEPDCRNGPLAVVLAPTRELAQQIEEEARPLAKAFGCTSVCVFGGQDRRLQERQIARLRRRLDLVVATPGRLVDFMQMRVLPMHAVRFFVLDEADRMLDMGFEPQLRDVAADLPSSTPTELSPGRQTLMFSATWPKEVCGSISPLPSVPPLTSSCRSLGPCTRCASSRRISCTIPCVSTSAAARSWSRTRISCRTCSFMSRLTRNSKP